MAESAPRYAIGDLVRLKSGGPPMTVSRCHNQIAIERRYDCSWMWSGELRTATLHEDAVEPYSEVSGYVEIPGKRPFPG